MYLKSIEINGFKSFANKLTFEFPHGITGIVGPNGSGKSNIGDAVRWVLGEQSAKQLRGSRMEDVIFSGTESRKPMGFAYVAITFENSDRKIGLDYDEIKVARRVYRSGESEYLINGSICRRRQIVELFYDTGIGKDGYSIIGQGQVEKILSGRLEDSRELFDEAAGIAKFKKDRNVTEKSLEKARADLERVTDILKELEKQVGPLEEQSKKARQYLRLRDREKEIDIQLFLRDYQTHSQDKEQCEQNLTIVSEHLAEVRGDYDKIKEKNNRILQQTEEYGQQADRLEEDLAVVREEYTSLERSTVLLQHEMDKNQLLEEQYLTQIGQAEQEISNRQEQKKAEQEEISNQETALRDCQDALKLLEEDRRKVSEELSKLEAVRSREQEELLSRMTDSSDLKERLSRAETLEEQLNIRNAEYQSRYLQLQAEISEYHSGSEALRRELETVGQKKEQLQKEYDSISQKDIHLQKSMADLRRDMDRNNQNYMRNRSRYETLSNMTERYDGYQRSIQQVMEQRKQEPGIIGVVADILTMDQRYEMAIEIALGGALQNIVTEDEAVAKKMIEFLKRNRLGRATFLPLTSIRRRNIAINPAILEEEGVVGIASDLVSAQDRFRNLIQSLLGRTIVVENMDFALYLARKNNFSLRIVTIDGELLNPGGSITGGAYKNNSNLLGRHREIEECKEEMKKAKAIYQEGKEAFTSLQMESNRIAEQVVAVKEKLDAASFRLSELTNQLPAMEEKEAELQKRLGELREEHQIIKEQIEEIRIQRKNLSRSQQSQDKISEENQDVMADLEDRIAQVMTRGEKLQEEYNQLILKQSQIQQTIDFSGQTIARLQEEIQSWQDTILEVRASQNQLLLENHKHAEALKQKRMASQNKKEKILSMESDMEALKEARRKVTEELTASYKELEEATDQLRALEKEETRLSSRLEKVNEELDSLINYMWETYELTYNYALSLYQRELAEDEINSFRKEKKTIRQNIKALGPVNVTAIEEYQEVGERYSFMKEQYDDIKETEDKLVLLIDQFNREMRAQFEEKFRDIQSMFAQVFRDLFEGGSASLELMDETDILESGIRIIAQPPGKKLQNIMLLSGGERALTAIALLFAIQNLKPSPFCLLDEIEAALDDANILRFSRYLRSLSHDTQFIVITHRRGTMNAADVLYGITMQEKGISTLISVDLIDKELN